MPKLTPFLWFDNNAEEAMHFYATIFKNTKIGKVTRYPEGSPGPAGAVMSATFELEGQQFIALNGGPMYTFNEAISFLVNVETQAELDELWAKLTADGGESGRCGWLKDKFCLSWQIVPTALSDMLGDADPQKAQRVSEALLKMGKIDIAALQRAYDQAAGQH